VSGFFFCIYLLIVIWKDNAKGYQDNF